MHWPGHCTRSQASSSHQGIVALDTPLGSEQFTRAKLQNRIDEERRLWETIPNVPDLQCGWQILLLSGNLKANHTLCTPLPSISSEYGHQHDEGIWNTAKTLLGKIPGTVDVVEDAWTPSSLPLRMRRPGLRPVEKCTHAVYWASWADVLHMIAQRNPAVAEMVVQSMSDDINPGEGSLAEFKVATDRLDRQGFWWRPSWSELQEGRRPETHTDGEPGEWQRGWQYLPSLNVVRPHTCSKGSLTFPLREECEQL